MRGWRPTEIISRMHCRCITCFGTTFDMCTTSSQSEWYKFVEGPGLLLASAHWESLRPAFQKIDRVYTKAGGNLNLTNRRRRIIPVNDDEADAWVDDFSYHDTTNPRPEPRDGFGTPPVERPEWPRNVKRHHSIVRTVTCPPPPTLTKPQQENIQPQKTAGPSSINGNDDTNRRTHQGLPLLPRFIGDCRKAGFPNPLSYTVTQWTAPLLSLFSPTLSKSSCKYFASYEVSRSIIRVHEMALRQHYTTFVSISSTQNLGALNTLYCRTTQPSRLGTT